MFLFVHLEKSAGWSLGGLFNAAVQRNDLQFHKRGPIKHVPPEYFVVSSIRNPCTQCLSWWSYCCEFASAWHQLNQPGVASCGEDVWAQGLCPEYSCRKQGPNGYTCQVENYNAPAFLGYAQRAGELNLLYEDHFNETFSDIGPGRVNCWVRVENIVEDARKCLREYMQLTGFPVNFAALDANVSRMFWQNSGKHRGCEQYYSPEAEQHVLTKNSFLFQYFGYDTCCAPKEDL